MTAKPIADDFAAIREALERLEREKKETEAPKAWPDYAASEAVYGHYYAPDADCAFSFEYGGFTSHHVLS